MKRKLFKVVLAVFLVVSLAVNGSISLAQGSNIKYVNDKDKVVSKLLNAGWTMSQVKDLPESELLTYKDGQIVSTDHKYYRITSQKREVEITDEKTKIKTKVLEPIKETRIMTELTKDQCFTEVNE